MGLKLTTSKLFDFECANCSDCLNDDGKDKHCPILTELSANGSSSLVSLGQNKLPTCAMVRTEKDVDFELVTSWIDTARTEEINNVLIQIETSYHYDVLRGVGDDRK